MTTQGNFVIAKNINGEGGAILQVFRHLSAEEQRIACAILDGMQLQRQLDAQKQEQTAVNATAK
ncbi:MAG: hypothetical protein HFE43_11220 [Oscillospiraceae bacterium]|jgi:hypothetical protein|nr:hypothetical protein [Oscillospiraceae bacterium]